MTIKSNYVKLIGNFFRLNKNEKSSERKKQYMRNKFEFLGIAAPKRKDLLKEFIEKNGRPTEDEIIEIYKLEEREFQYIGIDLSSHQLNKIKDKKRLDLYWAMINHQPWWDTVDIIASRLIGSHFKKFPEISQSYTDKWIDSDDFWHRRISLIYQLSYKKETNTKLLFKYIEKTIDEKEFFIRKAIGWALRNLYKIQPLTVKKFVNSHPNLSNLSRREALKHDNDNTDKLEESEEDEDQELD
ncbi:hypothetical protein DLAC_02166 [Tieghemostelium lacteum]|uniref:DNA alkylation repair protein n=1 Tax=Tieghemostelium lacteum TaxID=361077 RepID=A0A152A482_TIELA|nr:hypothetical protein DLAC_02166 [Tieghemostelium lacteum]|eukprot:KYR01072.1 hypothetical protein DLAC_02166 [Tieghemostelium lacteum]